MRRDASAFASLLLVPHLLVLVGPEAELQSMREVAAAGMLIALLQSSLRLKRFSMQEFEVCARVHVRESLEYVRAYALPCSSFCCRQTRVIFV